MDKEFEKRLANIPEVELDVEDLQAVDRIIKANDTSEGISLDEIDRIREAQEYSVYDDIMQGLHEIEEHEKGNIKLKSTTVTKPDGDITSEYTIKIIWDEEAEVYVAINDEIPLALESDSLDTLIERVRSAVPELLKLNGIKDKSITISYHSEIHMSLN